MLNISNGQFWPPAELLNIGFAASLFFACLTLSLWKAMFDQKHSSFWRLTAACLWAGIIVVAVTDAGTGVAAWLYIMGWSLVTAAIAATLIGAGLIAYQHIQAFCWRTIP